MLLEKLPLTQWQWTKQENTTSAMVVIMITLCTRLQYMAHFISTITILVNRAKNFI